MHRKAPRSRGETGTSTLEYAGALGLVALLVVSLAGIGFHADAIKIMTNTYCKVSAVLGAGPCADVDLSKLSAPRSATGQRRSCDWLGIGCHKPTANEQRKPRVDIPNGLDRNSGLVKTLLLTKRGRATLQWLHDNHIKIVVDPDERGAYWDGTKLVMGKGFINAPVIVHEANHAKYAKQGRHPDVYRLARRAYVRAAVNEEVDGTVKQIRAAKEFRNAGKRMSKQPGEQAYNAAYRKAKDRGASDAEARKSGYRAVRREFYNGGIVTSTNNQSYPDYYGSYWDSVH